MHKRNIYIGLGLLIAAAIVAFFVWDRHQTSQLQNATLSQIGGATRALRAAMAPAANAHAISASAVQVDQDLTALRHSGTTRIRALAAGADGYLVTAREVLRRQAAMRELRSRIAAEIVAFRDHLARNRSAANWTAEAVRLKNQLEQNFREHQRTVEAHTRIADSFPDARKALAALVAEDQLIGVTEISALREAALAAAKTLATEMETLRGPAPR